MLNEQAPTRRVAIAAGTDRRELVRAAITALGDAFSSAICSARVVFIHPNLVTHFRPAASTDVEAVRGVIDHISLLRADPILVGDAAFHSTKHAFEKLGYKTLLRSGNVRLVDLNDDETIESFAYTAELGKRPLPFSRTSAESDCAIVVVPAKMHSYYVVSLSIKTHVVGSQVVPRSPFGVHARWPWLHTGYRAAHLTLAEVYAQHPAQFAVIDGTQAMEGNGPAAGWSVDLGWVIASANPVAADALAAWLMGLEPRDIGYLVHLAERGFGPIDPRDMDIIGPDPSGLRRTLARPSSYPKILEWK